MKGIDAILISVEGKNILIDGGYKATYKKSIKKEIEQLAKRGEHLDLMILTHFDEDHIVGLIALLADETLSLLIKEVWFNRFSALDRYLFDPSLELSTSQGISFEEAVDRLKAINSKLIVKEQVDSTLLSEEVHFSSSTNISVLSPTPQKLHDLAKDCEAELTKINDYNLSGGKGDDTLIRFDDLWDNPDISDKSASNGSSIAVMLSHNTSKFLFLGDAHINAIKLRTDRLFTAPAV